MEKERTSEGAARRTVEQIAPCFENIVSREVVSCVCPAVFVLGESTLVSMQRSSRTAKGSQSSKLSWVFPAEIVPTGRWLGCLQMR